MFREKCTEGRKFRPVFLLFSVLFVVYWFYANDSFSISRDGSVYVSYAMEWDESETEDIRYLTKSNIYQAAQLPVYRILQRKLISFFGENIYGIRIINLFITLLVLGVFWLMCVKLELSPWIFILGVPFCFFFSYTRQYMFIARPDWLIMCLSLIVAMSIIIGIHTKRNSYLTLAAIAAGLAPTIYHNGIPLFFAFLSILFWLLVRKEITPTRLAYLIFLPLVFISTVFIFFYFMPYFVEFKDLFANSTSNANRMVSGLWIKEYLIAFGSVIWHGYFEGKRIFIGMIMLIGSFLCIYTYKQKKINKEQKISIEALVVFYIFSIIGILFRSANPRHSYFFIHIAFLLFGIVLAWLCKEHKRSLIVKASILFFILLIASFSFKAFQHIYKNGGQSAYYAKLSRDLTNIILKDKGRVMTYYDFRLAMPKHKKFFYMPLLTNRPSSQKEFSRLLKQYDVNYVTVCERTRMRMEGQIDAGSGPNHYKFLKGILNDEFNKVSVIYNKHYRRNGDSPPLDGVEFSTEIWKRR